MHQSTRRSYTYTVLTPFVLSIYVYVVDPPERQPSSLADDPLSIITVMLQRGYSLIAPSLISSAHVNQTIE
jgi:hypothetical protein